MPAFLFTDIEGSTRIWETYPEVMRADLARHDALLQAAIDAAAGRVFKRAGDSFAAVFEDPAAALAAAVQIQRSLHAEVWQVPEGLRVRIAAHVGPAEQRAGDYFGTTLNRLARLLAAAHGGQILISALMASTVDRAVLGDVRFLDLGRHRLRDLTAPEPIFQVLAPGLPSTFPPIRTLDVVRHNLPVELTSFVGRDREREEVGRLLDSARLLTLTGPGGSGKTRLALQVAADRVDGQPDGVWFVDLSQVSEPAFVPQTVAGILTVREQPGRAILDTLAEAIGGQTLLLVLDNCEHVIAACAHLAARLLQNCPRLRILATSQERLDVPGEQTYPVLALDVPATAGSLPVEDLAAYSAVRLFVERARLASPAFALTSANARAVVEITARLDGIPLALELAAARVPTLSPAQIASRLDDRFALLTGGGRTAERRRQTLRGAIEWSHDLLTEDERTVFRRAAVFMGGFTLEAAEQVCAGARLGLPAVLGALALLVNKSLVTVQGADDGAHRYAMLETIRHYALEKLVEAGEAAQAARRHRDAYLALAEEADSHLVGPEQDVWLRRLDAEHGNIRTALAWNQTAGEGEAQLRLAAALALFWRRHGHLTEGRGWLDDALRRTASAPAVLRIRALLGAAGLAWRQGDYLQARVWADEALALSREQDDRDATALALNILGIAATNLGEYDRAVGLYEESLRLRRDLGDLAAVAGSLSNLGIVARHRGDLERAAALYRESLALRRQLGDSSGAAGSLTNLGLIAMDQGRYDEAIALHTESVAINRELGNLTELAQGLVNLATVLTRHGDLARAAPLLRESLHLNHQLGARSELIWGVLGLAEVALKRGHAPRAGRLIGAVEMLRTGGFVMSPSDAAHYEQTVMAIRTALGDRADAVLADGRALSVKELLNEAMDGAG